MMLCWEALSSPFAKRYSDWLQFASLRVARVLLALSVLKKESKNGSPPVENYFRDYLRHHAGTNAP
jgi:hypothetical protein